MGSAVYRLLGRRDLTVILVALLFAVQAVIRFRSHLSHDVAWYLYAGGRLLDGGALYEDIVEVNPPLGLWLAMPLVAIARAIDINATIVVKVALLALTAFSVLLSARFVAAATDISSAARHLLVILLAILMLFLPAADFGQREHVMILLVTPWVLLRWNRLIEQPVPGPLALMVGLAAAVGFWLKPHFLLAACAIEVAMAYATRSGRTNLRIETLAIVGFGAAYLFAVSLLFQRHLAPMSLLSSHAFIPLYGVGFEEVGARLMLPAILAVVAIASTALLSPELQLLRTLLLSAGAAFLLVYATQAGYRYQLMPALFFLALASGLGAVRVVAGDIRPTDVGQGAVAVISVVAIGALMLGSLPAQSVRYQGAIFEEAIAAEAPEARTIFIASTDVHHGFPLVEERGLIWASRFPRQWLAPYITRRLELEGEPDTIGRFALEATVDDLIGFAPDIVFVDESPQQPHFKGRPLDFVAFWNRDQRFKPFWKAYEKRGVTAGFGIYVRGGP